MNFESNQQHKCMNQETIDTWPLETLKDVMREYMRPVITSLVHTSIKLAEEAISRQPGVFRYEDIFNEVRPKMPVVADINWVSSELIDNIVRVSVEQLIESRSLDHCFSSPEEEIVFLDKICCVMKKHGFKTADEALEFLQKQQIN